VSRAPALAISIDCDGCTLERLRLVLGYWTGTGATDFGPGLGLAVASSLFCYSRNPAAPAQSAYLDGDREGLLDAYRRGWIDTLHTTGDFAADRPCTRELAKRAFDALEADGVKIAVWTNHGGPENRQKCLESGSGDLPGSDVYLADLARAYGIRWWWLSELTPVVGQDREATAAEFHAGLPAWKRTAARWLGARAARKLGVEPYPGNRLIERRRFRDGSEVAAFRRYGRWRHDTVSRLPSILAAPVLDRLEAAGGSMIVYLHIGPCSDETPDSLRAGRKALDEVARRARDGRLRVLRTAELLAESEAR
jgi:hypothetical protein